MIIVLSTGTVGVIIPRVWTFIGVYVCVCVKNEKMVWTKIENGGRKTEVIEPYFLYLYVNVLKDYDWSVQD